MIPFTTSKGDTAYVAAREVLLFDPIPALNACLIVCRNGETVTAQESAATMRARYDAWERRDAGDPDMTAGREVVRGTTDEGY